MNISRAIRRLKTRANFLVQRITETDNHYGGSDWDVSELGALKVAIRTMEILRQYGYVAVCSDGPLLPGQKLPDEKPDLKHYMTWRYDAKATKSEGQESAGAIAEARHKAHSADALESPEA